MSRLLLCGVLSCVATLGTGCPSRGSGEAARTPDEGESHLVRLEDGGLALMVRDVPGDSLGEKAGLKEGDLIIAVNDQVLGSPTDAVLVCRELLQSKDLTFRLIRDAERRTLSYSFPPRMFVIAESPVLQGSETESVALPDGSEGARLTKIEEGSLVQHAGLKEGDIIISVNGHRVGDSEDAERLYKEFRDQTQFVFEFLREGQRKTILVEIE